MSKESTFNSEILQKVKNFNEKVRNAIIGPNCLDPSICKGDCCFVNMDIPRALAEYYMDNKLASQSWFVRGSRFSFRIRMDLESCKCVFFDAKLNGCSLHQSGMKTPQCWVYPTGLDPENYEINCKRASGWKISNPLQAKDANIILSEYVELCKSEALVENSIEKIISRLNAGFDLIHANFAPYEIAGVQDDWDSFQILMGDGYSISMKHFCSEISCDQEFFNCSHICTKAWQLVQKFLLQNLPRFIESQGFKDIYTFAEVLGFISKL